MQILEMLFRQSTGGTDIAVDPTNPLNSYWPRARSAAGVDVLTSWFSSRTSPDLRTFLFLVGGPGGGKSHVSAELVANYTELNKRDTTLAQRSHLYDAGHCEVLLVNDATIDDLTSTKSSLAAEIQDCIENKRSLIACVNRGILVEENSRSNTAELPREILLWLSQVPNSKVTLKQLTPLQEVGYMKTAAYSTPSGIQFEICVAYVDACSLFEENPIPSFDANAPFERCFYLPDYKLTKWGKRENVPPETMPGLALIHAAVEKISADFSNESAKLPVNPITANLENLSRLGTVRNICNILRAAEIASGQRFTYREVWGVISRLVSGELSKNFRAEEVSSYITSLHDGGTSSAKAFANYQNMAGIRLSQGLFGIEGESLFSRGNSAHPITALVSQSDPVRDGQPGFFSKEKIDGGWVTPLLDSFAGAIAGDSPLALLKGQASEIDGDNFAENVTDFDWALDEAFVEYTKQSKIKDEDRNRAINWYAVYLSRLYAVLNGIPAFLPQTAAWIEAWLSAPSVPTYIDQKLLTLLRPRRIDIKEDNSYIPIFDSRTMPVTELATDAKLVAKMIGIKTKTRVEGDSIVLSIEEHGASVAEILFDFPLLRDALACTQDHVGATEVSSHTAPRLERLRAARLAPQMSANRLQISVIEGYKSSEVIVS